MAGIYEEVEIEDMIFHTETKTFSYPCPCGDRFSITWEELDEGEDIAHCPSCTLKIRVIFEPEILEKYRKQAEEASIGEGDNPVENGHQEVKNE